MIFQYLFNSFLKLQNFKLHSIAFGLQQIHRPCGSQIFIQYVDTTVENGSFILKIELRIANYFLSA